MNNKALVILGLGCVMAAQGVLAQEGATTPPPDAATAAQITAQSGLWVQIESLPDLAQGTDRAKAWQALFADVVGFEAANGWHVITLGPFADEEAANTRLRDLRRENLIPRDSFVADGSSFGAVFYAADGIVAPAAPAAAEPAPADVAVAEPAPAPVIDETPEEARAAEAELDEDARKELQTALQWYGFYSSSIDGSFGRGTRASMAAWQEAQGFEPTGILTTKQREALVGGYQGEQSAYGFETVTEGEAGIEVSLPLSMVEFDHYEPPFVHFKAKSEGGPSVILISLPGDQAALAGLYDTLQALEIMPLGGPRELLDRSFTLTGANDAVSSSAYAEVSRGMIKGWLVTWNPANGDGIDRILTTVEATFRPVGDKALDPGLVPLSDETRSGLLAGLEVRKPKLSRSGFYVDATGSVLTTVQATDQCARITLDGGVEASVAASDAASGLAVLTPATPLSPPAFATFASAEPEGAAVTLSGYSYESTLPAPVLTYGAYAAAGGLNGETGIARLSLQALPGDAGGPVVDTRGAVLGMLLPRPADSSRVLPEGVEFAADASAIATALTAAGITATPAAETPVLPPDDLVARATGMTVLVSCWE